MRYVRRIPLLYERRYITAWSGVVIKNGYCLYQHKCEEYVHQFIHAKGVMHLWWAHPVTVELSTLLLHVVHKAHAAAAGVQLLLLLCTCVFKGFVMIWELYCTGRMPLPQTLNYCCCSMYVFSGIS